MTLLLQLLFGILVQHILAYLVQFTFNLAEVMKFFLLLSSAIQTTPSDNFPLLLLNPASSLLLLLDEFLIGGIYWVCLSI